MKKKSIAAIGLIAAITGAGLLTAPGANAATQGDRVEGAWVWIANQSTALANKSGAMLPAVAGQQLQADYPAGPRPAAAAAAVAGTYSFPAPGTNGPVHAKNLGDSYCLTVDAITEASKISMLPCTGAETQNWMIEPGINGYSFVALVSRPKAGVGVSGVPNVAQLHVMGSLIPESLNLSLLTPAAAPVTASASNVNDTAKTATVSGTGEPGATITVTTPAGDKTTTVDANGNWTVDVDGLATGTNSLPVTQTVNGEAAGSTSVDVTVAAAPVTATVSNVDDAAKSATVSGKGEPGATITVTTPAGDKTTTVDANGNWTVDVDGLKDGENALPVVQTINGNPAGSTTANVTITPAPAAEMTAVVNSVDQDAQTANVGGTGEPGATVTVTGPNGPVDFIVDNNGNWSGTVTDLVEGNNNVPVYQTVDGVKGPETTLTIDIAPKGSPLVDPRIAGGAAAMSLLALGGAYAARRKKLVEA